MSIPKWLDGKTPQERGRRFEKKLAKKLGGRVQPGSGSVPMFKEDIVTDEALIQVKHTTKQQYTLKLKDLETLVANAVKVGKEPVFVLYMGKRTWVIKPQTLL